MPGALQKCHIKVMTAPWERANPLILEYRQLEPRSPSEALPRMPPLSPEYRIERVASLGSGLRTPHSIHCTTGDRDLRQGGAVPTDSHPPDPNSSIMERSTAFSSVQKRIYLPQASYTKVLDTSDLQ